MALGIAAALVAGGCGDDDEEAGGGEGAQEQTTLRVGVIPIADVAPLYLGIDQGFFEDQQLKIEPQLAEGGAAITPVVLSGDFQIGFSNTVSLLIAASKDLPVTIISQGVLGGKTEDEAWADLLVLKDGLIKEPKDLEGKTIAVNTLKNVCEVTIRASLADMGVDDSTLEFTEVPFPDMNAALEAGRVDGACVVEPFVSQGTAGKAKGIDPFYVNTAPRPHGRDLLHVEAVRRGEPRRHQALRDGDGAVARVRPEQPGRGARHPRRVHRDPARGRAEHQAAAVAQGPDAADDRAALTAQPRVRPDRGGAQLDELIAD